MLFSSLEFAIFLPVVFILYWFATSKNLRLQNFLLLTASYFFYGWWDWRYLILLFFISISSYILGNLLERSSKRRVILLIIGLVINLGTLVIFKYFNFFYDSFAKLISLTGYNLPAASTKLILPLGISFYIFLSLSYIIDVYKQNISTHKNPVDVLLSFSFFPIILAGPIHRPSMLLNQISKPREFTYELATDGLRQILWGLLAKVVIADRLASYVDEIFRNSGNYSGSTLVVGVVLFTIQIYADFSGYSNIAIGIGKLFGFSLIKNFNYPYFSRDISEFWKRWHISLTTWFRDYVFLPLSFSISAKVKREKVAGIRLDYFIYIIASLITWLLTGLWHGSHYTFVFWGLIHGIMLISFHLLRNPRKKLLRKLKIDNNNRIIASVDFIITFFIVMIAWTFFKANNLNQAFNIISVIFSKSTLSLPEIFPKTIILLSSLFFLAEFIGRNEQYAISSLGLNWKRGYRWALYCLIIMIIFLFAGKQQEFIYFQF